MSRSKYDTCIHVESVGAFAVYVKPSCPQANMVKGRLVSSKNRCMKCNCWKGNMKDGCHGKNDE